jgi:hypothetical protein
MSAAGVSTIACVLVLFALACADAAWRSRRNADLRRRWRARHDRSGLSRQS